MDVKNNVSCNQSNERLLLNFKFLNKFKDQKWLSEESMKNDVNHKELPLRACFALIEELKKYLEETKFKSNWEMNFSTRIKLEQMQSLLLYFCEDTEEEKVRKGSILQ